MSELTTMSNKQSIFALWNSLPGAEDWGEPMYVCRCVEKREFALIGGSDYELFAVLHLGERRVVTEAEFPNDLLNSMCWLELSS